MVEFGVTNTTFKNYIRKLFSTGKQDHFLFTTQQGNEFRKPWRRKEELPNAIITRCILLNLAALSGVLLMGIIWFLQALCFKIKLKESATVAPAVESVHSAGLLLTRSTTDPF